MARTRVLGLAWIGVALALASCSSTENAETAARKRCEQLRDHLIDLRLADVGQDHAVALPYIRTRPPDSDAAPTIELPPPPIDLAAHRAAMKQALSAQFVGTCATKMTVDQVECAIEATSSAAVSACTRAGSAATTASR